MTELGNRSGRASMAALLCLALLLTTAEARAATSNATGEMAAVIARISQSTAHLTAVEQRLEARFDYTSSKATLLEAMKAANAEGNPEALAGRLYVLWRDLKPVFARYRGELEGRVTAIRDQGHVPVHDVPWLMASQAALDELGVELAGGLEGAVTLIVSQHLAEARFLAAEANLQASRRAMRGVGSRGMTELLTRAQEAVTEARAAADAAKVAVLAHETSLRGAGARRDLLPEYVPISERPLHPLTRVSYGGQDTRTEGGPATNDNRAAEVTAARAASEQTLQALALERQGPLSQMKALLAKVTASEAQVTTIRRPEQLPDVKALMARKADLNSRILAERAAIAVIDLEAPNGRDRAQQAAQAVLALQGQVPALDAEITRFRSKAHLAAWRAQQAEAIARDRAAAHTQRKRAARVAHKEQGEMIRAVALDTQLADLRLQAHVTHASRLARATDAHPALTGIVVQRPEAKGHVVALQVRRPARRVLVEAVADAQTARTTMAQAVSGLTRAWAAVDAAHAEAEASPSALGEAELQTTLAPIWKRRVRRLALKGTKGALARALRAAFDTPSGDGLEDSAEAPARSNSAPAGDLTLALERFDAAMSSSVSRAALRKLVLRHLRRKKAETDEAEVEAAALLLEWRARRPFLLLSREAYATARSAAEAAGRKTQATYAEIDPMTGGHVTRGVPLRVGDPVSVTLTFDGQRGPCPSVRIGPHAVERYGREERRTCRYHAPRLGTLVNGDATLHIEAAR